MSVADPRATTRSRIGYAVAAVLLLATIVVAVVRLTDRGGGPGLGVDAVHGHRCTVNKWLVPACGRWWGIAPLAHTGTPLQTALPEEEKVAGRSLDIVHTYHVNGDLFPTSAERSIAEQPGHQRLLLINWKPSTSLTWRQVADGGADATIDREAAYLKRTYRHRFFLDIWHEPENDVSTTRAGMSASDYSAMYRHVVSRLRSDGVTWAVTVMNYMGFDNWALKPWFDQLWPGRKYVDWIGIDPYGSGAKTGWLATNFATLVNRPDGNFPGFYSWAQKTHPHKPIMLAEWGVQADPTNPGGQARFFRGVMKRLGHYPAIKALVYFDMPSPPSGQHRTYLQAAPQTVTAYRDMVSDPKLVSPASP